MVGYYSLIAHWIWYGRGIQETIILVLLIIKVTYNRLRINHHNDISIKIIGTIIAIVFCYAIVSSDSKEYIGQNLKAILCGFLIFVYLCQLRETESYKYEKYKKATMKLLNIYTVINNIIIIIQSRVPYFMMNKSVVSNRTYFDQLTGLIGLNGTTRWAMICTLVILMNWNGLPNTSLKKQKKYIYYNVFLIISCLVISILNKSRSFILIVSATLSINYVFNTGIKNKWKFGAIAVAIGGIVYFIYRVSPAVNSYISELINDKVSIYTLGNIQKMIYANDDRIIAVEYAIRKGGLFGKGLGIIPLQTSIENVQYMGINSVSSFVYIFGIVGYIVYVLYLVSNCTRICNNHKISILFTNYVYLVLLSYLLPLFTYITLMFCCSLILIELCSRKKYKGEKYE